MGLKCQLCEFRRLANRSLLSCDVNSGTYGRELCIAGAVVVDILVTGLFHKLNCRQSLCYYHESENKEEIEQRL